MNHVRIEQTDDLMTEARTWLQSQRNEVIPMGDDYSYSSLLTSLAVIKEVGTINDELARFLFDKETGQLVPLTAIKGTLIKYQGGYGVEINVENSNSLEIRALGLRELLHPDSFGEHGVLERLILYPEVICKVLASKGITATIMKPWAMNILFNGFDPSKEYYQTNYWELVENDTIRFCKMITSNELVFLGTHDLIAHISGANEESWKNLVKTATEVLEVLTKYFSAGGKPNLASLILSYTAGVILDDLAQPPSYDSESHLNVLHGILDIIEANQIPPEKKGVLLRFPSRFEKVIELSRAGKSVDVPIRVRPLLDRFVFEMQSASLQL
jgi:hypothetical protein